MTPKVRPALFITAVFTAIACHEASEQADRPPVPPAVPAASGPAVPASTGVLRGDTVPFVAPDTALMTADSLLPKQSYEGIPGWASFGIRHPRFNVGDIVNGKEITEPMIVVDSGISVFPDNDAWKGVGRGTPLVFISPKGEKSTLYTDGESVWDGDGTAVQVRARLIPNEIGWLVPRSKADDVTALPIRDSVSADGNTRIWTAGDYRIRLQRTGKLHADLFAEARGQTVKRKFGTGIDREADSAMGMEIDTLLDLKSMRAPEFLAAYHFASTASTVFIYLERGYECANYPVVIFRPSRIDWIEEPHYSGPCAH